MERLRKLIAVFLICLTPNLFGASAINGVGVTAWNGLAFTGWNGTSIAAAGGGGGGSGPVVFDAASGANYVSGTTVTWSHTCTGSDRVLVVGVAVQVGVDNVSVTYAGAPMTKLKFLNGTDNIEQANLFILPNPASGPNAVLVTFGAGPSSAGCGAVSFTNCDTTTPNGTVAFDANTTANGSVTVGSVGANDYLVDCFSTYNPSITVGADQTSRYEVDNLFSNNQSLFISTQAGTAGGVMSATHAANYWAEVAVAIKPKP